MMKIKFLALGIALGLLGMGGTSWALPEIIFMHAFKQGDFLEKKLAELVEDYNKRATAKGQVQLFAGGDYTESFERLTTGKIRPHLAMVSEYNSLAMYDNKDLYVPIENVLPVKEISFLPVIRQFYSFDGKMMSYPFNCSVPVLYYNKEAFKKAGLPDRAPTTWEDIETYSDKLVAVGYGGFTFAWPAAYALEHFSVIHNLPFASHHNGFKNPRKARLTFNTDPFIQHLTFLQTQARKGNFVYAGERSEDAEQLFAEGKVGILLQGANRANLIQAKSPKLIMGVGPYPYRASLVKRPYAINIGGTSLWVINAYPTDRDAVADFLHYLSSAEVQAKWHQDTAYLPVTRAAYQRTKKSGFYKTHPAAFMAMQQIRRLPQNLPQGIRLPEYGETRAQITEMLGRIFRDQAHVEKEVNRICAQENKFY